MINLELPYPPSVNHYYRHVGNRVLISKQGREYRKTVCLILAMAKVETMEGPLKMDIQVFPPDRRRRDLDNLNKAVWDSMEHGGAYINDSQIVAFTVVKREVVKGGKVVIQIEEWKQYDRSR